MRNLASRLWRDRSVESGAASTELLGMFVVATLMMGVVLGAAPGWGNSISCGLGNAVARVGNGSWSCDAGGSGGAGGTKPEAEPSAASSESMKPCLVSRTAHKGSLGGEIGIRKIVSLTAEGNGEIAIEKLSDGTYRVTDTRGGKLGISAGAGMGPGTATIDNQNFGNFQGASAGVKVGASLGETYTVNSEEEVDDLIQYLAMEQVARTSSVASLANSLTKWRYTPPKPDEYHVELKGEGYAQAEATGPGASVKGQVGMAQAVGMTVNTKENTVTTRYKVSGEGSAQNNAFALGVSGEGSGEMEVAVTASADGNKPLNVSVTGMGEGSASMGVPFLTAEKGGGKVWNASLDLTDENKDIATNLLKATGIKGESEGADFATALDEFINASQITSQDLNKTSSRNGFNVGIGVAGISGEYIHEHTDFSNGKVYRDGEWHQMEGC